MADSETSMTLPAVPPTATISTSFKRSTAASTAGASGGLVSERRDPAILASRRWRLSHERTHACCRKQQTLEEELYRLVRHPQGLTNSSDLDQTNRPLMQNGVTCVSETFKPKSDGERNSGAEAIVSDATWNESDRALDYTAALEEEALAAAEEDRLAEILWSTPASSIAGVISKLEAVSDTGEPNEGWAEFPWPQLRLILVDLRRLQKDLKSR